MRIIAAVAFAVFSVCLGVACANDGPPLATPRETLPAAGSEADQQQAQQEQPEAQGSVPQASRAAEPPASPESEAALEPVRNSVLIMRLERESYIYPRPESDSYEADHWGAGGLLLADGWLVDESGDAWLRLDMNGERVGWVRLSDSPLTLEEARTLPEVEAPALPSVQLQLPTGEVANVTLLGRSEDGRRFATQFPDRAGVRVWVYRRALATTQTEFDVDDVAGLPVYVGPTWGELRPSSRPIAEARAWSWLSFATRPGGEASAHRLDDESHAILGRSPDGEWVALRVDTLRPEYVWVRTDRVDLNQAIDSLPVYVGKWMQTVSVESGGHVSPAGSTSEPLYHWQWRDDGMIVGSNDDGLWLWNPATGVSRKFADRQWVKFSPDGRYAASGCCQNYETGDLMRDVTMTPVDGGEPLVFVDANRYRFSHHSEDPSLHWSPDSTHVLSEIHGDAETGVEAKHVILGVDGSRTEVPWQYRVGWLPDGTLYHVEDAVIRVYEADASLIREIPFDGWPQMHIGVNDDLLVVAQATDHREGYWLVDLSTGARTKLPTPLDLAPRSGNASGWRPLVFAGSSLYFFWSMLGRDQIPDGPLLYRYDVDSGRATPVVNSDGYDFGGWPRLQEQCAPGCERFALAAYLGPLLIVDPAREETISVPLPTGARSFRVVDWSPDSEQLLVRLLRETAEYDDEGFAAHSQTWWHGWEYAVSEYLIIDALDGSVLQRMRSPVEQCWAEGHTGAWSHDGGWLAFGGEVVDCT